MDERWNILDERRKDEKKKTGRTKGADDDKQKRETFSMKISLKRIIDYIRKICV